MLADLVGRLTAAVADVLRIEDVDPDASFLNLGGTSLDAVRVRARFAASTGYSFDVVDLLRSERLGELALHAAPATERPSGSDSHPLRASDAQLWMLAAEQADPDHPKFQFACAFEVDGPLDVPALAGALEDTHRAHEVLHTSFAPAGDEWTVEVHSEPLSVEIVDGVDPELVHDRLSALAQEHFPAEGPDRWRVVLVSTGPARHYLGISFDHRVVDGWSLNILLDEISRRYLARLSETGPEPAAPSYLDLLRGLDDETRRRRRTAAVDFWRVRLPAKYQDYPFTLPGRLGDPAGDSRVLSVAVSEEVADALHRTATMVGQTVWVVATSALAQVLHRRTGSTSVRILTSAANRSYGTESTVGWFANGLLNTYRLAAGSTLSERLEEVARESTAASAFSDVPARYVRCGLWPDAPAGYRTDSQIYLAVNEEWTKPLTIHGCTVKGIATDTAADSPGIELFLEASSTGWVLDAFFFESEYPMNLVRELMDEFLTEIRNNWLEVESK
ncbi:condensation domain-containing protein [Nocardioides bruguierae]|uniref:Condensation domain-containing protein n=1 Tax=Nocardioides bruguierae TaxID=2945102 RepID=A0A9X2DAZ7_9ACTN|nr:condensation domain-containing protein [Nocardioides bruguierae]MCM0622620.1 condensation domain-containing protein [Nocardioides bruguierae]